MDKSGILITERILKRFVFKGKGKCRRQWHLLHFECGVPLTRHCIVVDSGTPGIMSIALCVFTDSAKE